MQRPVILAGNDLTKESLADLRNQKTASEFDLYESQLEELFEILHPSRVGTSDYQDSLDEFKQSKGVGDLSGTWVFLPWRNSLLHIVGKDDLYALRTNRNKNLITEDEQQKIRMAIVAVAGMSVGSGLLFSLIQGGMSQTVKMADFDVLETTNLNRVKVGLDAIGRPKLEAAAYMLFEMDPFVEVIEYDSGIDMANIGDFLLEPRASVVVDEIDDFKMKVLLRIEARKRKIPAVMLTSLGDSVMIDIERHDVEDVGPFNGLIGDVPQRILSGEMSKEEKSQLAVKLVGRQHVPQRAIDSVGEIGKTLSGRPQLGNTVAASSGIGAYFIRRLLLHDKTLKSGRYIVDFAKIAQ